MQLYLSDRVLWQLEMQQPILEFPDTQNDLHHLEVFGYTDRDWEFLKD